MYGYATNETPEMMPLPYMVATKFLELMRNHPSKMFRADAKAQVSFDYDSSRTTTFLCSVQHSPDVEVGDFRHIIESMMVMAACEYGLNGDFQKLVNPTGRFVVGGSFADCGVTGRKLACDTYGGIGRIGGGALSGKDPTKVDRSGAYMARRIAKDIVQAGYADKCEVQLAYAIGVTGHVFFCADDQCSGLGCFCHHALQQAVEQNFFGRPFVFLGTAAPHSGQNRFITSGRNASIASSKPSMLSASVSSNSAPRTIPFSVSRIRLSPRS